MNVLGKPQHRFHVDRGPAQFWPIAFRQLGRDGVHILGPGDRPGSLPGRYDVLGLLPG